MVVSGWGYGFAAVSVVCWGLALFAAYLVPYLLSSFGRESGAEHGEHTTKHHHHHHGLLSSLTTITKKQGAVLRRVLRLSDSEMARDSSFSALVMIAVYFMILLLATLCAASDIRSPSYFGITSPTSATAPVIDNLYAFFGIGLVVSGALSVFSASASAGAAFPVVLLSSAFTGFTMFLLTCTPSGDFMPYGSITATFGIGLTMTLLVIFFSSRDNFTIWRLAYSGWYLLFVLSIFSMNSIMFNINTRLPWLVYRILVPMLYILFGLVAIPLGMIAGASMSKHKSRAVRV